MDSPLPASLLREISPPRSSRRQRISKKIAVTDQESNIPNDMLPSFAAVEAGRAKVRDHLVYFTEHVSKSSRTTSADEPRLSVDKFVDLYQQNQHQHGNHFVIHQHNHPRAGVHYDLRLQFSQSSSLSFAIPKGLPGDPNSKQQGRMAIETRVHNLWNHLIESASLKTGSLLIWDTGTYTILPRKPHSNNPPMTDYESDSTTITTPLNSSGSPIHDNEKLIEAFQDRYIRLRLQGTRLPNNYAITLRLPSANNVQTLHKHRPRKRGARKPQQKPTNFSTDSGAEVEVKLQDQEDEEEKVENLDSDDDDQEDRSTRIHNAYLGSINSIGSIHQRRWFLTLDRQSSGFFQKKSGAEKGKWVMDEEGGVFEPFHVRGRNFERSVITGRLAAEVEIDEGLEGYVGRAGWVGITA